MKIEEKINFRDKKKCTSRAKFLKTFLQKIVNCEFCHSLFWFFIIPYHWMGGRGVPRGTSMEMHPSTVMLILCGQLVNTDTDPPKNTFHVFFICFFDFILNLRKCLIINHRSICLQTFAQDCTLNDIGIINNGRLHEYLCSLSHLTHL